MATSLDLSAICVCKGLILSAAFSDATRIRTRALISIPDNYARSSNKLLNPNRVLFLVSDVTALP